MSKPQYFVCEVVAEKGLGIANPEECLVLIPDPAKGKYQIEELERHGRCGAHPGKGFVKAPEHIQKELEL